MLGKVIKHEFINTWRYVCTMYGIIVTMLIISSLSLIGEDYNGFASIMIGLSMVLLAMSLWLGGVIIFVILCKRFFDSVYSNQGYLTHTLPVGKLTLLNGKLITYIIWFIISVCVIVPCGLAYLCNLGNVTWVDISDAIIDYIFDCEDIMAQLILPLINLFIMVVRVFLFIFAALSLGQLSNKHKVGMAIVWGFVMGVAQSFISGIISYSFMTRTKISWATTLVTTFLRGAGTTAEALRTIEIYNIVTGILIGAVYYAITAYMMSKKPNLQ